MSQPIDSALYREVCGYYATGVTIVTAAPDGKPVGLAANSFTSVSLDPPLVLFCPGRQSSSWPRIAEAGVFCVNVLAEDQEHVSRVFAGRGEDKFAGIGWRASGTGSPMLHDALAWIDCEVQSVHEAGDHWIVVGAVKEMEVGRRGLPLLFYRGGYGRYEP